jgi:hypothetical protein
MNAKSIIVSGTIVEGHRVASGPSREYPYGSLERQIPLFTAGGLNLEGFFRGTLNVSISPLQFELVKPAITFRQISWTDLHPPEDFSFSACMVRYRGRKYGGYVYYPHPETKIRDFHDASVIEVITGKIAGIGYGGRLDLILNPDEIKIIPEKNLV